MFCSKCGKEIPDGKKTICDDCEKEKNEEAKIKDEIKEEEDIKTEDNQKENEFKVKDEVNETKGKISKKAKIIACVCLLIVIAVLAIFSFIYLNSNKVGNTIGNIRNYGRMAVCGGKIYYVSPNETADKICIYTCDKNGEKQKKIYETADDILSLNIYKNKLYFITIGEEYTQTEYNVNNKICSIDLDGSNYTVINDNEFDDTSYEMYLIKNKIYYIGADENVYRMNLNGANREVVNSDGAGFIGVTDKYLIFNIKENEKNEETGEENTNIVTYVSDLDGSNKRKINGSRLYSINLIGDEIYYVDEDKNVKKYNLSTNEDTQITDPEGEIAAYNMNISNKYIYYMNYCDDEYNVAIYRMKLDGSENEQLYQLDNYSNFLDVGLDKVLYMDNNDEKGVINLLNPKTKEIKSLYEYVFETDKIETDMEEIVEDTTAEQ